MRRRLPGGLVLLWAIAASTTQPAARPASLDDVVARASAFVAAFQRDLSLVVLEERYEQTVTMHEVSLQPGTGLTPAPVAMPTLRTPSVRSRTLVSDLLLLNSGGELGWVPFRDVYEVDGVPVQDRTDRLARLFLDSPRTALTQAVRIREESSRYNIGPVTRTVNVPTLALLALDDRHRGRFTFELRGTDTVDGIRCSRVAFIETTGPSLIVGTSGVELPMRGEFLVDPADGHVAQSVMETRQKGFVTKITVRYRLDATLAQWIPVEMRERYENGPAVITGVARYANPRRFRVETSEIVK